MSQARETLGNLIEAARNGNEAAVRLLRNILVSAAEQAPPEEVVRLSEYVRDEVYPRADRMAAEQN